MDRIAKDRLTWKCRRGLFELDLILERLLQSRVEALDAETLAGLDALLDLPDNDLWDIVAGRSDRFAESQKRAVAELRNC